MSPRLPSGTLLALTVAMTAATAVMAALPASAGPVALGGPAASRGGMAPGARSDQIRAREWWLASLHVPQAWQSSRGAGITVAVLSSGVEAAHPDLTGSVVTGPDLTGSGEAADAPSWGIEGTSAASIIAGHGDNVDDASGIIGIAPAARVLSIRVVLDATDPLNANPADVRRLPAAIAAGIRYAAGHGAQVIDLPLDPASLASDGAATGGLSAAAGGSAAERAAVSYALGKGAVLVAPAGDNGEDGNGPTFPAAYPGVIALGAVDRHFVRAAFSTRQSYVALTAPGVNLTTASPPSGYRTMSTTDAAGAVVAGVAALIRSRYPALTGRQVRQALVTGSVARPPSATTPGYGSGTVDALKAIEAAALIAAPRASASAPSTPSATAQAPPGKQTGPAAGQPKTGILGRAKTVLRDAAVAAGMLIVLLLASLVGIRVRRRRAGRATLPAPEPRTLLNAPSGPLTAAGGARHTRAAAEERAAAAQMAAPGAAPWRTGRARQDWRAQAGGRDWRAQAHVPGQGAPAWTATRPALPGAPPALASRPPPHILPVPGAPPFPGAFPGPSSPGLPGRPGTSGPAPADGEPGNTPAPGGATPGDAAPGSTAPGAAVPAERPRRGGRKRGRGGGRSRAGSRISAHGLRLRVTPPSRTVTRAQVTVPGGPPWEPAPMPEGELPQEAARRAPDPFALFVPPAPRTPAPWDVTQPGHPPEPRPMPPPGHSPPIGQAAPPDQPARPGGRTGPMGPARPGPFAGPGGPVAPAAPAPSAGPAGPVPPPDPIGPIPPLDLTDPLPSAGPTDRVPPAGPTDPVPPAGSTGPMPSAGSTGPPSPAGSTGPMPSAGSTDPASPESPTDPVPPAGSTATVLSPGPTDPIASAGGAGIPSAGSADPMPPSARLPPGRPVPPVDPEGPGGTVPPRRPAVPGGTPPLEGRLPLARPSSFAGSSGPPDPPPRPAPSHPADPAVPPPEQRDTTEPASGPPEVPGHSPGTGPRTMPPPGPAGSGSPRWRRSPYSGRHASDPGPQPAAPGPGEDPGSSPRRRTDDAPSGPLYVWNPAAAADPFPSAPPPHGDAGRPGEGAEDTEDPEP